MYIDEREKCYTLDWYKKGLSCLSNKDKNKIETKLPPRASQYALFTAPIEKLFNSLFAELRFSDFI